MDFTVWWDLLNVNIQSNGVHLGPLVWLLYVLSCFVLESVNARARWIRECQFFLGVKLNVLQGRLVVGIWIQALQSYIALAASVPERWIVAEGTLSVAITAVS